nr:MAG TPA: hypothetical protein [Caudoviricetes sp.]
MFSELFDFMKTSSQDIIHNKKVNLGNRRIKSISSFSSNSIFYFPVVISDQCQMDEVTMIQRALEKQYASFIVACISQIPFHRVSSGDAFAVDEYLKQFHQNMGVSPGKDAFAKAYNAASLAGVRLPFEESASGVESVEDFFARVWNESVEKECDYVTYLAENYISINDVFNESASDPYTKALTDKYKLVNEELEEWGFIGTNPPESITEMTDLGYEPQDPDTTVSDDPLDSNDTDSEHVDGVEAIPGQLVTEAANPVDRVKYTLESISDNKIRSCKNRSKLRSIESKLKGLKKKYTNYLIRYKRRYEENKSNGTKKKLHIRFNKESIKDPKSFMKEYGSYMKIINHKLKLCEERREELTSRSGKGKVVTANETVAFDMTYSDYLQNEAAMSAKARNGLADDVFGLPSKRKYPLNDAKHVKLAIQMSGHINNKAELEELASNIAKRAGELDMEITVSKKNALHDYMPKSMQESVEEDPLTDLTSLDENALDMLIESIDSDLSASDSEIFVLTEDGKDNDPKQNMVTKAIEREKVAKYQRDVYKGKWERSTAKNAELQTSNDELTGKVGKLQSRVDRYDADEKLRARNSGRNNLNMARRRNNGITSSDDYNQRTFDREVFTKMDMQKCNEMVPTFTKATIGFIVDETEEVVNRDLLVGIKTYVHRVKTSDLTSEIYNAIMNKRKFLKFVKFISGEERSLADLLFGVRELKGDALKTTNSGTRWSAAFKNRKRMSKMSIPFLMNNYLPNGTIVITMNEVDYIKSEYGVDIMRSDHCRMLMDANFLLGFVVLDQTNEIAHVMYDGINGGSFQQYSYAALEREQQNSDRAMKEMFRLMNR